MRTKFIMLVAALLLVSATVATAQQDVLPSKPIGSIDLGFRFTDVTGDKARYERYRDFGDGGFLDRFRWNKENESWLFNVGADHVGRLDQRFFGEFRSLGKVKASFEWNQIPLFISRDTKSPYTQVSPGVFRLSDNLRALTHDKPLGVNWFPSSISIGDPFKTKSRRDTAAFNLVVTPTRGVDVKFNLTRTKREGSMPFGASFAFSEAVELPVPIDTRTTDVNASAEWANKDGMLSVGYTGSWFDNNVQTLIWDNPLRLTDTTNPTAYSTGFGSSQGRMALWPNSNAHTISTAGSIKLPAHSRFTGNVAVGTWNQNQALLPFTINTAIAPIPLERPTAEAEARTLAMNSSFTSRPSPHVWLSARYRYYDFNNKTPRFPDEKYVRFDGVVEEGGESEPFGYTRHNIDVDASFTPIPFAALRVGYGRDMTDRTFRLFSRTTEDTVRASVDSTGNAYVTVRAIFEHSKRRGSGFDPEVLADVGEQPTMQHYDLADRDRDRVTALVQVTPNTIVAFNASVAAGKDDYVNSGFGLRNNENRVYTVGVDLTPTDKVAFNLSYDYEKYTALQKSRTASPGPQFVDPTRDWWDDSADKVHTVSASLDLLKLVPSTEVRLGYDWNRSRALYVYSLAPNTTLPPVSQLPPLRNELQTGIVDVRYFFTKKVALGVIYRYDSYAVDDFAQGPATLSRIDLNAGLMLGYLYRPYTANAAWVRVLYFF